jgi:hypothetical protein
MKLTTPIMASILFLALIVTGVAFVVAGTSTVPSALPPIGAGFIGGALAYFLLEMSAWDRARRGA